MQVCILVSCGFMIDAFRLLAKEKRENEVISKSIVTFLSIAFGAFGLALVLNDLSAFINKNETWNTISYCLLEFFFFLSCLTLAILLFRLTKMQGTQFARTSAE